jgi:hypothetical protein
VCVVRDGMMSNVSVQYNHATGDSLYQGLRFRDAFPVDSSFTAGARWFHDHQVIAFARRPYVKYGLPRALRPDDVVPRGTYRGVTVFAQPTASRSIPEFLYLPVHPNCEFQPYETEIGGAVRG